MGKCNFCGTDDNRMWGYCCYCFDERKRIMGQLRLARVAGCVSDLTQTQWRWLLEHFDYKCAYCLEENRLVIEHFLPIRLGGGTTISNCVPACRTCNSRKGELHPDQVTRIPRDALERVRSFLESQKVI